jgi:teichuronic acid biosynthesis glycosyltransferase TuaC
LAPDQVVHELHRSDAFVLASRSETFGIALAEALACGLPAVATRTEGAEFVTAGLDVPLVPVNDDEALARAMAALMTTDRRWDGQAARQSIQDRFGPDTFLVRIGAVYDSLSGRQQPP